MTRRLLIAATAACAVAAVAEAGPVWNFDEDRPGSVPTGFYVTAGQWKVKADKVAPSPPNVLAQLARSSTDTFNLALVAHHRFRNLELSVKMRPVDGATERGGGLAWRVQDPRNYYVARYSPRAGDFALYKVHNFGRVELRRVRTESFPGWHTLRVTMTDDLIECYLDGKSLVSVRDATFPEAGQVGFWTKGDAVSYFDDFKVSAR